MAKFWAKMDQLGRAWDPRQFDPCPSVDGGWHIVVSKQELRIDRNGIRQTLTIPIGFFEEGSVSPSCLEKYWE
ncbi:MAG: hypothetical protein OXI87_00830 [Albidovulum sp.]|nr:hypothetical protein [Albidovulum sp.]